jgi:dATP pyrophosphohydrolase
MPHGRAPLQVLVLPYKLNASGTVLFAVLHRADSGQWQAVAGGAEDDETAAQAAVRETSEEIGLVEPRLMPLDSVASIPAVHFPAWEQWRVSNPQLYVVPEYAFAVLVDDPAQVRLSREHDDIRWLPYDQATQLLTWDSNRNALWELRERLRQPAP